MCLYINNRTSLIKLAEKSPKTFYKVFIKEEHTLRTPYMKFIVRGPGIISVPNPLTRLDIKDKVIVSGGAFHARTKSDDSKQDEFFVRFFKLGKSVKIPIYVKYEDILAYGLENSVAITAYEITEKIWNDIFRN